MRSSLSSLRIGGSRYVCPSCSFRATTTRVGFTNSQASRLDWRRQTRSESTDASSSVSSASWAPHSIYSNSSTPLVRIKPFNPAAKPTIEEPQGPPELIKDSEMLRAELEPTPLSEIDIAQLASENEPDRLLAILTSQSACSGILKEATPAQFQRMLYILSPDHFAGVFARIYRDVHREDRMPARGIPKLDDIFKEFKSKIEYIFRERRKAGHTLGLPEYTYLLNCAKSMGDANLAEQTWQDMQAHEVEPDTACYNYHMEAKSWEDAYLHTERFNLRVIKYNMINRRAESQFRKRGFRGVSTGPGGTKSQVLSLFHSMTTRGIPPNEESYIQLMVGSARDGDLKSCQNILHQIWGIPLSLLDGTADDQTSPHMFHLESPLRPTERLLFTICHCWAINNELPTALRLIDAVSTTYSVPVPRAAWSHLLEWSYVLSTTRYGKYKQDSYAGFIPNNSPRELFGILVAEPYNIKPTIPMINIVVHVAYRRDTLISMLHYMDLGRERLKITKQKAKIAFGRFKVVDSLFRRLQEQSANPSTLIPPREWYRAKRVYEIKRLAAERDQTFLRRWIKLLLENRRWNAKKGVYLWEREKLQNCLVDWQDFLPKKVIYRTKDFMIHFEHGSFEGFSLAHMFPDIKEHRETGHFYLPEQTSNVNEGEEEEDLKIHNYQY